MGIINTIANYYNNSSLRDLEKIAEKIELLSDKYQSMTDDELRNQTRVLKGRLAEGQTLDDILPDAYAVVREAATRVLGMRHFHVQLLGGIALHQGRIAEMNTGEGKTLVSSLPAYLNALSGNPVHIVTSNEYLAKRDADWIGKIHKFLGLSVGYIYNGQPDVIKKRAYACDITYGTNSEFGFDYLRDNMCTKKEDKVQRGLHYAIIDEVDSILIDEAKTPLIISRKAQSSPEDCRWAAIFASQLTKNDVEIDEKHNTIALNEDGLAKAEKFYGIDNLSGFDNETSSLNYYINNAIRARFMMHNDKDYIVQNGEVLIVDESTGRIKYGCRFSNGLHQAIEAKELVEIKDEHETVATINHQGYFSLFKKISGMTGTAKTAEKEFREVYNLDVVTIPTNNPSQRVDENDVFFFSRNEKIKAICEDIKKNYEIGRPVLIGTIDVADSEMLSGVLKQLGIPHNVLNAKNHAKEAEIIAQAGRLGAVTISTNMAGRGTDILLGGNSEFMAKQELKKAGYEDRDIEMAASFIPLKNEIQVKIREQYFELKKKYDEIVKVEKEKVSALGGLRVIGTERHESRRIDNQLRGRAGRQGDPGSSVFYISADDDLARIFGGEKLKRMAESSDITEFSLNWKMFSKLIENAQKNVEAENYESRKRLFEYGNVLDCQRNAVYGWRDEILDGKSAKGKDMHAVVLDMIRSYIDEMVNGFSEISKPDDADIEEFNSALENGLLEKGTELINLETIAHCSSKQIADKIFERAIERFEQFKQKFESRGQDFETFEKEVLLGVLDKNWIEQIDIMENLKEGIGLRGYADENPLTAYQIEGYKLFNEMIARARKDAVDVLLEKENELFAQGRRKRIHFVVTKRNKDNENDKKQD